MSNIFMLDIVKIAASDNTQFWSFLLAICVVCYCWFALVMLIMANVEEWLSKFKAT